MNTEAISVLLVDDDPDEKYIFSGFLADRTDLTLRLFFETGTEMLNYLAGPLSPTDLPDLIFLDHNMPKLTGFQVLEQTRQSTNLRNIPVVVYSTYVDAGLAEKCMSGGALAVFTKPLTSAGYNEMVDEVLRLLKQG